MKSVSFILQKKIKRLFGQSKIILWRCEIERLKTIYAKERPPCTRSLALYKWYEENKDGMYFIKIVHLKYNINF